MTAALPILEAREGVRRLPGAGWRAGGGGPRRQPGRAGGRDRRADRRIGQRQDHAGARPDRAPAACRGRDPFRWRAGRRRTTGVRLRAGRAICFPGSGGRARSAQTVLVERDRGLAAHRAARDAALRMQARALFERVRLPAAALDRFPHQLSGGQRQRVALARALAVSPRLLISRRADIGPRRVGPGAHPQRIARYPCRRRRPAADLHDLAVVRHLCRFVAVMTGGRIVEAGPREQVLEAPEHPYTKALLQADRALRSRPPGKGLYFLRPATNFPFRKSGPGGANHERRKKIACRGSGRREAGDARRHAAAGRPYPRAAPGTELEPERSQRAGEDRGVDPCRRSRTGFCP